MKLTQILRNKWAHGKKLWGGTKKPGDRIRFLNNKGYSYMSDIDIVDKISNGGNIFLKNSIHGSIHYRFEKMS